MTGVFFVLVVCLGAVAVLMIGAVSSISRTTHQRSGLYGRELRRWHEESEALVAELAEETARAELRALSQVVVTLDRVAFAGVPVSGVRRAATPGWWEVSFRDGTSLCVRPDNPKVMGRVNTLASTDPLVVSRVRPHGATAVVELATPRHHSLQVALRT